MDFRAFRLMRRLVGRIANDGGGEAIEVGWLLGPLSHANSVAVADDPTAEVSRRPEPPCERAESAAQAPASERPLLARLGALLNDLQEAQRRR